MLEEKEEGIVLRSFDFKERDKIITLLTENSGVVTLIVKGINRKNQEKLSLCSPFSQGEYIFQRGRLDLYKYVDGSLIDPHLFLRENLEKLSTAGQFVQDIMHSQLPEKPAPLLYRLLSVYLKQLKKNPPLAPLAASFRLKLLKHEGALCLSDPIFTETERPILQFLLTMMRFEELENVALPANLDQKISFYLSQNIHK
jgi:DNA repair protein RecO (recombination protein O)